jgi:high-affinity iron transporter
MEAVIFVGGVSLGQPATSIPIATIVGLVCGVVCGVLIYAFASRTSECFCLTSHINIFHNYLQR